MPNFDPQKLAAFLEKNKSIEAAIAQSIPDPKIQDASPVPKTPDNNPFEAYFKPGSIVTVDYPEGTKQYRIITTKDGVVSYNDVTQGKTEGPYTLTEEELRKSSNFESEPTKPNVPALSELFGKDGFTDKTSNPDNTPKDAYILDNLLTWKKKWIDSGKLDEYRRQHGNITISDEQIEETKKTLDLYVEALQTEGLPSHITNAAAGGVGICAKILAGIHHPPQNDIEYLVTNYKPNPALLERLKSQIENKPAAEPTPPSAISPAAAPTIAAAPAIETPPDVRSTWPRHIIHDSKKGWLFIHKGTTEHLPTDAWNAAEANIKPIFDEYFKFITEGNASDQKKKIEFFSDVIALKNEVIRFLNEKDPESARTHAEALKGLFTEQKRAWESIKKELEHSSRVELFDKKYTTELSFFTSRIAMLKKVLSEDETLPLLGAYDDVEDAGHTLRESLVANITGEDSQYKKDAQAAYDENLKALHRALTEKESEKKAELRELRKQSREEGRRDNDTQKARIYRTQIQLAANRLLRKVDDVEITDTNKSHNVDLLGGGQMKLEDYVARHKAEQAAQQSTQEAKKEEVFAAFEKMFQRNQKLFTGLYADVTVNQQTGDPVYTENRALQQHPNREVILSVFDRHGIRVATKTRNTITAETAVRNAQERKTLTSHRLVYKPTPKVKEKKNTPMAQEGAFSLGEKHGEIRDKVLAGEDEGDFEYKARIDAADKALQSTLLGKTFPALRAKLATYASNDKRPEYLKLLALEEKIDALLREAQSKQQKDPSFLSNDKGLRKLNEAIDEYEKTANAFLAKKEDSPEIAQKKKETLKKIDAIITARTGNLANSSKYKPGTIRKYLLASLVTAAGTLAGGMYLDKYFKELEAQQGKPTSVEQLTDKKTDHLEYIRNKELIGDIQKGMSDRDLVVKYVPLAIDKNKTDSVDAVLTMIGKKVLEEPGCYALTQGPQLQVCDFIRDLENISQGLNAPERIATLKRGGQYSHPSDWFITTRTIGEYQSIIREKVNKLAK